MKIPRIWGPLFSPVVLSLFLLRKIINFQIPDFLELCGENGRCQSKERKKLRRHVNFQTPTNFFSRRPSIFSKFWKLQRPLGESPRASAAAPRGWPEVKILKILVNFPNGCSMAQFTIARRMVQFLCQTDAFRVHFDNF